MNPELFILALASTFRLSSLAAVYALVQRDSAPRLLAAYIIGGLAFVFTIGAVVVLALHGVEVQQNTRGFRRVAELIAGGARLVLALFALGGRLPTDAPGERRSSSWARRLDSHVTNRGAAIAGVVTHLPGVFYLVALDLIISWDGKSAARGLRDTAMFDAIWFALPIAVLLAVIFRPEWAREAVDKTRRFAASNAPQLIGAVSALLGLVLIYDALQR